MKKYKMLVLSLLIIYCFGCNTNKDNHQLTCTITKRDDVQTIIFSFNDDNTRVLNVNVETVVDISNYDEEFKSQLLDFSGFGCSDDNNTKCSVNVEDDKAVEIKESTGDEYFDNDRKTLDEVQQMYESDGFSCK